MNNAVLNQSSASSREGITHMAAGTDITANGRSHVEKMPRRCTLPLAGSGKRRTILIRDVDIRSSQARTFSHWKPFMMLSLQVNICLPTKNYNFKKMEAGLIKTCE